VKPVSVNETCYAPRRFRLADIAPAHAVKGHDLLDPFAATERPSTLRTSSTGARATTFPSPTAGITAFFGRVMTQITLLAGRPPTALLVGAATGQQVSGQPLHLTEASPIFMLRRWQMRPKRALKP